LGLNFRAWVGLGLSSSGWGISGLVKLTTMLGFKPGANPTTSSHNASVVKIYNATTSSLLRFEIKKKYFLLL
jgi:hypothetical protein